MAKYGLFVGDLAINTDEIDLEALFSPFGMILDIRVQRDKETGASLSYGFIDFTSASAAVEAMRGMNGAVYKGRPMRVRWASSKTAKKIPGAKTLSANEEAASIYVTFRSFQKNKGVSEEMLRRIFGAYGTVIDATIRRIHADQNQWGYGFVRFANNEEGKACAIRATLALRNVFVDGVSFKCDLSHSLEQQIVLTEGSCPVPANPTRNKPAATAFNNGQNAFFQQHLRQSNQQFGNPTHHQQRMPTPPQYDLPKQRFLASQQQTYLQSDFPAFTERSSNFAAKPPVDPFQQSQFPCDLSFLDGAVESDRGETFPEVNHSVFGNIKNGDPRNIFTNHFQQNVHENNQQQQKTEYHGTFYKTYDNKVNQFRVRNSSGSSSSSDGLSFDPRFSFSSNFKEDSSLRSVISTESSNYQSFINQTQPSLFTNLLQNDFNQSGMDFSIMSNSWSQRQG